MDTRWPWLDLSRADLSNADLHDMLLDEADLLEANLTGADLSGANLMGANLSRAVLQGANLTRAVLLNANLTLADLRDVQMTNGSLGGAALHQAQLCGAWLDRVNLTSARLVEADLTKATFLAVNFTGANLSGSRIAGADFTESLIENADFFHVRDIRDAKHLESTQVTAGRDALHLDTCPLPWQDRRFGWESLRTFGKLPLFGASYSALVLLAVYVSAVAWYNGKVDLARDWAADVTPPVGQLAGQAPHGVSEKAAARMAEGKERAAASLARAIEGRVHRAAVGWRTWLALASSLLLVVASTAYRVSCPSRVQEYSKEAWCYELNKSLLHYWPLSWRNRPLRMVCLLCYLLGGLSAAFLLLVKVVDAVLLIAQNC